MAKCREEEKRGDMWPNTEPGGGNSTYVAMQDGTWQCSPACTYPLGTSQVLPRVHIPLVDSPWLIFLISKGTTLSPNADPNKQGLRTFASKLLFGPIMDFQIRTMLGIRPLASANCLPVELPLFAPTVDLNPYFYFYLQAAGDSFRNYTFFLYLLLHIKIPPTLPSVGISL